MNYFEYFGLLEHPFQVTPDSRFLYLSSAHAQAMAYMEYSVWKRDGFAVITGEIGSGKTILIHRLLSDLDSATTVIQISQTQLTETEFLQTMLVELGFSADEFMGDQARTDNDAVLLKVKQMGGAACHTGYKSCFFKRVEGESIQIVGKPVFDPKEIYKL